MIIGEKITLRAIEQRDIETLRQWRNHPELFKYHFRSIPVAEIEQQNWYQNYLNSSTIVFMIDDEQNNTIGYTLIKDMDQKNRLAEIGLHLDPDYQGKGYGKDAFKTLMRFCFHELNLHRIFLQVHAFNERACKLYETLGFKTEGRLRDAFFTQNAYHDVIVMSMLEDEFGE